MSLERVVSDFQRGCGDGRAARGSWGVKGCSWEEVRCKGVNQKEVCRGWRESILRENYFNLVGQCWSPLVSRCAPHLPGSAKMMIQAPPYCPFQYGDGFLWKRTFVSFSPAITQSCHFQRNCTDQCNTYLETSSDLIFGTTDVTALTALSWNVWSDTSLRMHTH